MREVLESIKDWLVHLFSVHCDECLRRKICPNCENYLLIIEKQRGDYQKLLERVMTPAETQVKQEIDFQPIIPRHVPWHIKQRELEMRDREMAINLRREAEAAIDSNKSTAQLEKELIGE